jgi:hypothetical protein
MEVIDKASKELRQKPYEFEDEFSPTRENDA